MTSWVKAMLQEGATPGQVAGAFVTSPEYRARIVTQAYTTLLGRQPEPGAADAWLSIVPAVNTSNSLMIGVLASPEYFARQGTTPTQWVRALYRDVLGRQPDEAGLDSWLGQLTTGATQTQVAAGVVGSTEAHQLFVLDIYQRLLGRTPDPTGLANWTQALNSGLTREQMIAELMSSPELADRTNAGRFPVSPSVSSRAAGQRQVLPTSPMPSSPVPTGAAVGGGPDIIGTDPPPDTPPYWDPNNCCPEASLSDVIGNADGYRQENPPDRLSEAPVRYFDGTLLLQTTDFSSMTFGTPWGLTRSWTNGPGYAHQDYAGNGEIVSQLPYFIQANNGLTMILITNGINAREWDYNANTFSWWPHFFLLQETLTYNSLADEWTVADTKRNVMVFAGFATSEPTYEKGQFKKFTDRYGNVLAVTSRDGNGWPSEVQRTATVNGVSVTESVLYTGLSGGSGMQGATLRYQVNGGAWTTVRQTVYAYYDGVKAHGNLGDLLSATIEDGSGNALDTYYYRYYTTESAGYQGGLKYVFSPDSYARLVAAVGNVQTATDAQVAPYADYYFQYDANQRVTQEVAQGKGSSLAGGGLGTYTFAYSTSSNTQSYSTWTYKTIETLPDGNQNIVYCNYIGEVLLKVYHDVSSGNNWEWFFEYDSAGRPIVEAMPSALSGYDETKADLLNSQNGNYQYLNDSTGQILITDYFTSTTATSSTAGGVQGYIADTKLQQGELGTAILQSSQQYYAETGINGTVYPVANTTVYRNTDGTGIETTSYSYTMYAGTDEIQSMTGTYPTISSGENGPGTADTETTFYDPFGRPIWFKDGDGYLFYTAYDSGTGAVAKTIDDVNTADTGDFANLPTGWTTPSGGGLELITQYTVDALGRPTKVTRPQGNIDYMVYDDPNHAMRVYPGWNSGSSTTTGPTQVYRVDRTNSYTETLTMTATPHTTGGIPDGTEAISGLQTLTRDYVSAGGQLTREDRYYNLAGVTYSTAPNIGTLNTNYYEEAYDYDTRGWLTRDKTPTGTIARMVHDGLGRTVSIWVGTNDTPASGSWSPTNNTPPSNMVQTIGYQYDSGGVGDGDLTQETDYPGGSAANRVTQFYYDWRDRLVASKQGVQGSENDGTHRPILYDTLDNLDEVTKEQRFDGDAVTITSTNGVPNAPSASLLRTQTTTSYDEQGRSYQVQQWLVNQTTGAVGSTPLTTNAYYNHRGFVIETSNPGGEVDKSAYDGAGRVSTEYVSDGAGGTGWSQAGTVTGDNVLEQTEYLSDGNDNVIQTTVRQRFHDETATGALGNPTTSPKARVSYTTAYYDNADRLTAQVDVGTNGGTAYSRPGTVPSRSATVLVTSYAYNAAGWVQDLTDPRAIDDRASYDNLGRVTQTIQDYTNGTPTNSTDKTTNYTYDGDDHVLTLQAVETGGASETTQWVYGVTTGTGSTVNSNDLVATVKYPDPSTGSPSTSYQESYTANALGDLLTYTDRNGTVHTYSYDILGRLTADSITTLAAGVDGAVRRLEIAYGGGGLPRLYTSYSSATGGSGNIVNQVQEVYNGLLQVLQEYQSHSGAVNTSTTPSVQYAYNQMAGGANNSRPTGITYPNGRVINLTYNTGVDTSISRLSSISSSGTTLESYKYLGLDTVVERDHTQTNVNLTYISQTGSTGDAGDKYTGLDRFGRVVDQNWYNTATQTSTDRFQYGYDQDGNVLYKNNLVNSAFSELYHTNGASNGYDGLNQMTAFARGTLSDTNSDGIPDTVASPSTSVSWNYDALGNWTGVTVNGTPTNRTHNQQNETTAVGAQSLTFDKNGNMITDDQGHTLVYDAWNRLVTVKNGGTTLEAYSYDALARRITENAGTLRDLYFSSLSQVVEEDVSGSMQDQFVWSPESPDWLVERDTSSQRLYAQQDASDNITALVNTSGTVIERYGYGAYGAVTYLTASWGTQSGSAYAWQYLFGGSRLDTATGLYRMVGEGDYSPTLGRWGESNPLAYWQGDANVYRSDGNAPAQTLGWGAGSFDNPPSQAHSWGFGSGHSAYEGLGARPMLGTVAWPIGGGWTLWELLVGAGAAGSQIAGGAIVVGGTVGGYYTWKWGYNYGQYLDSQIPQSKYYNLWDQLSPRAGYNHAPIPGMSVPAPTLVLPLPGYVPPLDTDFTGTGGDFGPEVIPATPPARSVTIHPKKAEKIGGPLSVDQAVDDVQGGGDVIARDKSTAHEIAKRAGGGCEPEWEGPHGPGQHPHYHPTRPGGGRLPGGGHVMY